jgi:uncharacterized membrane protein YsdA (DUF1294 family)
VTIHKQKPRTMDKSSIPIYCALIFLALMCVAVVMGAFSWPVLAIYIVTSFLTFINYWVDKVAAKNRTQRTPESSLHLLSLIGGWPGGLFAQRIFRHKSIKKSFQSIYWTTVFLNIIALYILSSPIAEKLLGQLFNVARHT